MYSLVVPLMALLANPVWSVVVTSTVTPSDTTTGTTTGVPTSRPTLDVEKHACICIFANNVSVTSPTIQFPGHPTTVPINVDFEK